MGDHLDDPNREAVGVEPAWVEGTGGNPGNLDPKATTDEAETEAKAKTAKAETEAKAEADAKAEREKLPGQHAGLDELAAERGYEWSRDDLTVAEKQAELSGEEKSK